MILSTITRNPIHDHSEIAQHSTLSTITRNPIHDHSEINSEIISNNFLNAENMKHFNHYIIGGATCYLFNPPLIPVAMIGSVAPDYIEYILNSPIIQQIRKSSKAGGVIKHRTTTHIMIYWIALILFAWFVYDFRGIIFWFAIGGFTHVFTDALSPAGIPLTPFSTNRSSFFGGKIQTGVPAEYAIAIIYLVLCLFVAQSLNTQMGFVPFFYNWAQEYNDGLIDGYEWKLWRFKIL